MAGIFATGYRKASVARIIMKPGTGVIKINGKTLNDYFIAKLHQIRVLAPLKMLGKEKQFDFTIQIEGGGLSGQVDSVKHAIAKAMTEFDATLKPLLKEKGLLTRDSRIKERVKAGLRGARKARQYRKR
jgi:small subunit ribosomal protein S9